MCSIVGVIDYKFITDNEIVAAMNNAAHHRGPDAGNQKIWRSEKEIIALAHKRLSIIDLSETGAQPMEFQDLAITFNGEIYNYKEIKSQLCELGHSFNGNSDTEVILHAYKQWGIDAINRFIGMFSFALYDQSKNKFYCIRDRAGIKPFFYYKTPHLFLFASELKSFHKHPGFKKHLNPDALAAYMQYGNVPTPHCIFKDCYKINPGHYLEIDLSNFSVIEKKYWSVYDYYNKPKLDVSYDEAKLETEKLLKSAASYRMIADVPVGLFLSGGYDSSCLTALLNNSATEKLKTYTIAVPDIGLNEAPYAAQIAKYLGTDHNEFECTKVEAIDIIKNLPFYYDEPFGDSSAIPTTLVCKMARNNVKVALSADAGDEVFAGYNRYDYFARYGKRLKATPKFVRHTLALLMNSVDANSIPYAGKKYNFYGRYEKLKELLKNPDDENILKSLSKQFSDSALNETLKINWKNLSTNYESKELKKEFYTPLSYMMAIDYQTYLVDDILQKVDRASMSVSLEAREPYLDHRIIEWAAQLPDQYKYNKGIKKFILREITHKYIPKELLDRPKMGFAIPIEKWLQNELRDQLIYYSEKKFIEEQGVFEYNEINKLVKSFLAGKLELGVKIWYFYMFQLWYQRWMID